jgi:putative flippase GtrA
MSPESNFANPMNTLLKYSVLVILQIFINLLTQFIIRQAYTGPFNFYLALAGGTIAGLIIKYPLDKKFIFNYAPNSISEDAKKFITYTYISVFTTLIFWAVEMAFHLLFDNQIYDYIGGFLGLIIGNFVKYQCDKAITFKTHYILTRQ